MTPPRDTPLGILAQTFREAMRIWDQQKADGVSEAARRNGLEQTLRAAWPQTRVWHYLCVHCEDHGLVIDIRASEAADQHSQPVYRPCHCARGARFRPRPPPRDEDFVEAGKTRKSAKRLSRVQD